MLHQSIKKAVLALFIVVTALSCNDGLTLQTYYVDNELRPGFTTVDVPTSVIDVDKLDLTKEQKEAYKAVDKLNMLSFIIDDSNKAQYEVELAKIKTILKNPKYEELMRGGNSTDGQMRVMIIGDPDSLDELILFGNANDKGFAVVRILGDDMNAGHLVQLGMSLQKANLEDSNLGGVMDFFK